MKKRSEKKSSQKREGKVRKMLFAAAGVFVAFLLIIYTVSYRQKKWSEEGLWMAESREASAENQITKSVALTYDDGPDPVYTEQLLKVLEEEGVKASFFLLGKSAAVHPEIVKEIAEDGHLIGNHTYSHSNLCTVGTDCALEECRRTNQVICDSCGRTPDFFRPPFGGAPKELEEKSGMVKVLWDVDPRDWECQDANAVVEHVLQHVEDGDIILLHDAYASTVEATRQLIPLLRGQGYEFVTVDELLLP